MGQGGSRVTLMEAWPASLRILSTKLCCSCACKCQLPSLISPFPRRTPALPQLAPRALWRMHCVQHPRAKPGGGCWTEASLVHLTRFSAPLAGAELRSFAMAISSPYTLDWTSPFSVYRLPWGLRREKICPQCGRTGFDPWVRKNPWRKGMATHSSILAWRIPWTEEPGSLHSSQRHRVGHGWVTNTFSFWHLDTPAHKLFF